MKTFTNNGFAGSYDIVHMAASKDAYEVSGTGNTLVYENVNRKYTISDVEEVGFNSNNTEGNNKFIFASEISSHGLTLTYDIDEIMALPITSSAINGNPYGSKGVLQGISQYRVDPTKGFYETGAFSQTIYYEKGFVISGDISLAQQATCYGINVTISASDDGISYTPILSNAGIGTHALPETTAKYLKFENSLVCSSNGLSHTIISKITLAAIL